MVNWWGSRAVDAANANGWHDWNQPAVSYPTEVLTTPTRSKGQILPATTDGILTTTAITRARGLESLTTILMLGAQPKPTLRVVVHLIRFVLYYCF